MLHGLLFVSLLQVPLGEARLHAEQPVVLHVSHLLRGDEVEVRHRGEQREARGRRKGGYPSLRAGAPEAPAGAGSRSRGWTAWSHHLVMNIMFYTLELNPNYTLSFRYRPLI